MSIRSDFVALITDYGATNGLPIDDHASSVGLEFESGDRIVRILADIHDDRRFCIELDVLRMTLGEPTRLAQSLLLMHRFNDHARMADGWLVSIDPDDVVVLSRSQGIVGVGV